MGGVGPPGMGVGGGASAAATPVAAAATSTTTTAAARQQPQRQQPASSVAAGEVPRPPQTSAPPPTISAKAPPPSPMVPPPPQQQAAGGGGYPPPNRGAAPMTMMPPPPQHQGGPPPPPHVVAAMMQQQQQQQQLQQQGSPMHGPMPMPMGAMQPPPPHMMMGGRGPAPQPPPNNNMMMGGAPMPMQPHGPVPMSMPPAMAMQQQQPRGRMMPPPYHQQQQQQQQYLQQQHQPPPPPPKQQQKQRDDPLEAESKFKKKDFPALGAEPATDEAKKGDGKQDEKEEDGDAPLIQSKKPTKPKPPQQPQRQHPQPAPHAAAAVSMRITFNDPSPSAQSVPAKAVSSALMSSRDLCYVVHSMLRPLHSLDAYNDDYYRWGYADRTNRNALLLGGGGGGGATMPGGFPPVVGGGVPVPPPSTTTTGPPPKPVWKEIKIMAAERDTKFRQSVEKRAQDWSEKKHILGHVVKTNVKRPRALLSAPVLSAAFGAAAAGGGGERKDGDDDDSLEEEGSESEYDAEEHRTRVALWKARVSIDRGYDAYLALIEVRQLLSSSSSSERAMELTGDVESHLDALHAALGMTTTSSTVPPGQPRRTVSVTDDELERTLSMPKGRNLAARVLENGVLPHYSACEMLPAAVGVLFRSSSATTSGGGDDAVPATAAAAASSQAPTTLPPGEERVVRALTNLVRTVQPSLAPRHVLNCLDVVVALGVDVLKSSVLTCRIKMELLHSILSRGNVLCCANTGTAAGGGGPDGGPGGSSSSLETEWKEKEREFMALLAKAKDAS